MTEIPPGARRERPCKTEGSKLLREWRGERTQLDVSREVDLHPSKISLLENGRAEPDLAELIVFRDVCGIPVDAWAKRLAEQDLAEAS